MREQYSLKNFAPHTISFVPYQALNMVLLKIIMVVRDLSRKQPVLTINAFSNNRFSRLMAFLQPHFHNPSKGSTHKSESSGKNYCRSSYFTIDHLLLLSKLHFRSQMVQKLMLKIIAKICNHSDQLVAIVLQNIRLFVLKSSVTLADNLFFELIGKKRSPTLTGFHLDNANQSMRSIPVSCPGQFLLGHAEEMFQRHHEKI